MGVGVGSRLWVNELLCGSGLCAEIEMAWVLHRRNVWTPILVLFAPARPSPGPVLLPYIPILIYFNTSKCATSPYTEIHRSGARPRLESDTPYLRPRSSEIFDPVSGRIHRRRYRR